MQKSKAQTTSSSVRFWNTELVDILHLADLLDCKASEIREKLESDPSALPRPLRFGEMVRWPRQQVSAWYLSDCPRDFELEASEFCPRAVWLVSDNHKGGDSKAAN